MVYRGPEGSTPQPFRLALLSGRTNSLAGSKRTSRRRERWPICSPLEHVPLVVRVLVRVIAVINAPIALRLLVLPEGEPGGPERARTADPHNANVVLSQLSYRPVAAHYTTDKGVPTTVQEAADNRSLSLTSELAWPPLDVLAQASLPPDRLLVGSAGASAPVAAARSRSR